MKKNRTIIKAILCMMITLCLTGCGGPSMYNDASDSSYEAMRDVNGILFAVGKSLARNSTAINYISNEMMLEPDQTYLYKDGGSTYFVFNISSVVIIAKRDTKFDMQNMQTADDKKIALESNEVAGIWFNSTYSNLSYDEKVKDGVYKFIATANAEVAITDNLYNDFTGKIAILDDGNTEWTYYVGVNGTKYDNLKKEDKKALEYMAASLQIAPPMPEEEQPAVDIGGDYNSEFDDRTLEERIEKEEPAEKPVQKVSSPEAPEATETSEEKTPAVTEPEQEVEIIVPEDETADEKEDPSPEAETEDTDNPDGTAEEKPEGAAESDAEETHDREDIGIIEIEEKIPADTADKDTEKETQAETQTEDGNAVTHETEVAEKTPAPVAEEPKKRGNKIVLNNQKNNTTRNKNMVYKSSIYDLLDVGYWGEAECYQPSTNAYDIVATRVEEVLTGSDAVKLIKDASKNGDIPYTYFDPPTACSWHAVRYTINTDKTNGEIYMNIKLRGMDGGDLNYHGIKYSHRTYDIKISDTEFISYYAVPNGCIEYVLECGDGTATNGLESAYFTIPLTYD